MMRFYAFTKNVKEVTLRLLAMGIYYYIERIVVLNSEKPVIVIVALPDTDGEREDLRTIGFEDYSVV